MARSYTKFAPSKLSNASDQTDWNDIFACNYSIIVWNLFVSKFTNILVSHVPWKNMSVFIDSPPWVTQKYVSECETRDHYSTYAKRIVFINVKLRESETKFISLKRI